MGAATGLRADALPRRLEALGALLGEHRALWAPRPFVQRRPSWVHAHPEVEAWLRALSPDAATALDSAPHSPPAEAPAALRDWARAARELVALPDLGGAELQALAERRLRPRVPARKWAQVQAFVAAAAPRWPAGTTRIVDWCSGKGHLGRAANIASQLPVDLLERREDLCEAGRGLLRYFRIEQARFHAVDVLESGAEHLGRGAVGLGLHACGILWRTLLKDSGDRGAAAAVAPCCYHNLGGAPRYAPRSAVGRAAGLDFAQPELRLAVAEERVARPAIRRARRREQAWRLGLDLLLREASGEDRYVPQGVFPKAMLDLDFEAFVRAASEKIERDLPARFDPAAAERAGRARAHEVFALAQVRSIFRRPLELWLVLDAAVAELERGRQVEVGTFCAPELTPRNVMVTCAPR